MIKQLYIECTHTSESGLNTGIQRVVRKIINQLGDALADDTPITLVMIEDGAFYPLASLPDLRQEKKTKPEAVVLSSQALPGKPEQRSFKVKVLDFIRCKRLMIVEKITWKPLHSFLAAPRTEFGLSSILYFLFVKPLQRAGFKKKTALMKNTIEFSQGDTVLMLDSSWHLPAWNAINTAKNSGAVVISVIYDLIPITHPQFCNAHLTEVFNTWFKQANSKVDGYISISQTVQQSIQDYLFAMGHELDVERFGYFYLGADIAEQNEYAREALKKSISKQDTYLIVCTIEPRKNHQYLLDVFSELWGQGITIKLHIVGHIGWKVDALLQQIEQHPQLNKQLFIWNDLDDRELVYCYKHSKALVFPSIVEGFGLPIIEAQHFGLPVLASDTPIHREVGGDSVLYFDLDKKQDLVRKIARIEAGNLPLNQGAKFDLEQFTWKRSAEMLVQEIQRIEAGLCNV